MNISDVSPLMALKNIVLEIIYGLLIGFIVGMPMIGIKEWGFVNKAVVSLFISFSFLIGSQILHLHETWVIGIFTYGYICFRLWGHEKPEDELETVWQYCTPFLYGTIGASIILDDIKKTDIIIGAVICTACIFTRLGTTYLISIGNYTT